MAENDNDPSVDAGIPGDVQERDELGQLRTEVVDLREKHLRALAELENTRRRAERDRLDASQYAVTRFARDMLAVSDSLQRALAHIPPETVTGAPADVKAVLEGVEATERQLTATLERHGIRAINAMDAKFDPHLHQAIAEVPGNGKPAGAIVDVVQTGYVIGDRLLRPAMVTVARSSDDSTEKTTPAASQQPGG